MNINVSPTAMAALREMATDKGTSITEIVRRAIGLMKFVEDEIKNGVEVQLYDPRTEKVRVLQLI